MASSEPIGNGTNSSVPETELEPQSKPKESATLSAAGATVLETENEAEAELAATEMAADTETETTTKLESNGQNIANTNVNKWPGWPGDCVFRLVVPVLKVGSIIGRKGELIKKMCEETRARIRVLEGPSSSSDRIVLISGKEEPEAPLSPAMDAVIRIFKRLSGLPENESGGMTAGGAAVAFSSIRLLVASTQAINLIGKQGSLIKSIQESAGASVRVVSTEETPSYVSSDERIVELQGEALKVLKALEAVVGHLRKFLVDHSVLPLFEKNYNIASNQERPPEPWSDKPLLLSNPHGGRSTDYPLPIKRDAAFFERESHMEPKVPSTVSLFGQDPGLSGIRTSAFARGGAPIVTQVSQTMQIPLNYAEDIIGIQGTNIAYIRRTSGAILTVQESRGLPDEITVEIKGTSAQVQTAQQLIQDFISGGHHDAHSLDSSMRASYSQLGSGAFSSSSYSAQPYGSYGSSGAGGGGGYNNFRL